MLKALVASFRAAQDHLDDLATAARIPHATPQISVECCDRSTPPPWRAATGSFASRLRAASKIRKCSNTELGCAVGNEPERFLGLFAADRADRSEERRVGKECRSW